MLSLTPEQARPVCVGESCILCLSFKFSRVLFLSFVTFLLVSSLPRRQHPRRALSNAVHLSPSSISSWARLGAATADAAAALAEDHLSTPTAVNGTGGGGGTVSSKLAEACLSATEKHAMFSLLGKARDAGSGSGTGTCTNGEFAAKELATSLSGIAKAVMCGGGGPGNSKSESDVGGSGRAVRATSRAVHLYPGETLAWRCLATALVSAARGSITAVVPLAARRFPPDWSTLFLLCWLRLLWIR